MNFYRILMFCVVAIQGSAAFAQMPPAPSEAPDEWLLAFVDVETTGLIPGYHEMIDIGIVMTDLDGVEQGELFVRIQPQHPERTQEGARAVNAFDAGRWEELDALSIGASIDRIVAFHDEIARDKSVLMVILDLPSMAWSQGDRDLTGRSLAKKLGVADEPRIAEQHTGITGAQLNARLYRALMARAGADR
jgi:hypothetical protein